LREKRQRIPAKITGKAGKTIRALGPGGRRIYKILFLTVIFLPLPWRHCPSSSTAIPWAIKIAHGMAEGAGLEPARDFSRWISSPLPYQLGLTLQQGPILTIFFSSVREQILVVGLWIDKMKPLKGFESPTGGQRACLIFMKK
jgi:hypothetical protein